MSLSTSHTKSCWLLSEENLRRAALKRIYTLRGCFITTGDFGRGVESAFWQIIAKNYHRPGKQNTPCVRKCWSNITYSHTYILRLVKHRVVAFFTMHSCDNWNLKIIYSQSAVVVVLQLCFFFTSFSCGSAHVIITFFIILERPWQRIILFGPGLLLLLLFLLSF